MYFNIEKLFKLDTKAIKDPIVLIGWPGIALVAKLAISSIKDSLSADLLLNIEYFDFPPKSMVENGELEIPSAKVYYKSLESNDFFILTANFQPQSSEGVFEFSQKFCEEMHKLTEGKIKMYVSTGALISDDIKGEPRVHICGTDKELIEQFLRIDNTLLMESGAIAGANGILPAWAGVKGFAPGICLLAETLPLPMMALDPLASKALVSILGAFFNLEIDYEDLNKKIEEMEGAFKSFKRQADSYMRGVGDIKDTDSYFR
ncbi:MAG: PAC2 family protein [Promethearchaeota archaeon]